MKRKKKTGPANLRVVVKKSRNGHVFVGNSAFIAVHTQPPNCSIWVAFIADSNTFIVLGVKGCIQSHIAQRYGLGSVYKAWASLALQDSFVSLSQANPNSKNFIQKCSIQCTSNIKYYTGQIEDLVFYSLNSALLKHQLTSQLCFHLLAISKQILH